MKKLSRFLGLQENGAISKFTQKWRDFNVYTKIVRFQSLHTIAVLVGRYLLYGQSDLTERMLFLIKARLRHIS